MLHRSHTYCRHYIISYQRLSSRGDLIKNKFKTLNKKNGIWARDWTGRSLRKLQTVGELCWPQRCLLTFVPLCLKAREANLPFWKPLENRWGYQRNKCLRYPSCLRNCLSLRVSDVLGALFARSDGSVSCLWLLAPVAPFSITRLTDSASVTTGFIDKGAKVRLIRECGYCASNIKARVSVYPAARLHRSWRTRRIHQKHIRMSLPSLDLQ